MWLLRTNKSTILLCRRRYIRAIGNTVQCDAIRWEQFENWHFSRGYNFWTKDLILILKTLTHPYSCLAKVIICLNVRFISCRRMRSVRFRTVPIWLHHSVFWLVRLVMWLLRTNQSTVLLWRRKSFLLYNRYMGFLAISVRIRMFKCPNSPCLNY